MKTTQTFPCSTRSVKAARTFAVSHLDDLDPDIRAQLVLLVSELATNAVRHAGSDFQVTVERRGATVRIGVTDSGTGVPKMQAFDAHLPSGRGLQLVDSLSDS